MGILKEFKEFFYEYKVAGLAIAFVMGAAINELVQSLVSNMIMPLTDPLIPDGTWEIAVLKLGPFVLKWGPFVNTLIHFIIIAWVIFLIIKLFSKKPKNSKKR